MILVNGTERSAVPANDRGLAYGDGIFRTIAVRAGKPMHWARQFAKLTYDCNVLRLRVPEPEVLQREVELACAGQDACALKIIITRGEGARGYRYTGSEPPTRVVSTAPLPGYPEENAVRGIAVRLCALKLAQQPALAGVKHLNRLENVLARAEWQDDQVAEGCLRDTADNVIGGTMSNLFVVAGGAVVTPPVDCCGVAGVTRDRIIEAAAVLGIPSAVRRLSWADVLAGEEVFVANSVFGVWPVRELDGHTRAPGPLTRTIQRALTQQDHAYVG